VNGRTRASARLDIAFARRWGAGLAGTLTLAGDEAYEEARQVWNRAVDRHPAAIVRCASVDDVVRSLELAERSGLAVAVRGGGHSQAGHGVADDAIVIDLGGLDEIEVDPRERVVRVSAGARVAALLEATRPHGLATPTGGCPDVGLGGLTLGGGENLLMARHGAVCDNVLAARVVLADGRVVTADAHQHADLFWAIRGGGGNFGIVTAFDYRLHPLERVVSGLFYFPVTRTGDVLRRYRDLMIGAGDELQTAGGLIPTPDGAMLMVSFCHCGDTARGEAAAARWRSALAPVKDTVRPGPYTAEFVMASGPSKGTGAFLPDMNDAVIRILHEHYLDAPRDASAVWNDFHGAVTRVGVHDMAFPLRHAGYDLFVSVVWERPDTRSEAVAWVARLEEAVRPFSRGVYVNNLEDEGAERVRQAYGPNYPRLAALKARYDPRNVLHINQNIQPAD
jgi:FAD/FMN-containing dehydrogenase